MHKMNIANFDLNLLRVFDAMFTERNVTRAAQRVFLSQPAVSHALARLRKEFGDPLFVRAGNEMIPTRKATAVATGVRSVLEQLGALLGDEAFDPKTSTAVFRVGTQDFGEYILAPLFTRLMREEAPHARFLISEFHEVEYQAQLASGALDVVVSGQQSPGPGHHVRKFARQELVGLVRNGHPLTRGRASAQRFRQQRLLAIVTRSDRFEGPFQRILQNAGIAGQVAYATPHFFAVPTILANSDLLVVSFTAAATLLCAQYPLSIVKFPVRMPPVEGQIIWHERTHRDPAQRWMRDRMLDAIQEVTGR
jgi:DNA-binding transcriptional LysR family regulator